MPGTPVIAIYGDDCCPYCGAARLLLKKKGLEYTDISVRKHSRSFEEMRQRSGRDTVPQIFFGDTCIGGFEELMQLEDAGELDQMLAQATKQPTS